MYAIFKSGCSQHKASQGDKIVIDYIDLKENDKIEFDQVLGVAGGSKTLIGAPTIEGAKVIARVVRQRREPKVIFFQYRRRKNHKKKRGHVQPTTEIEITEIRV